MVTLGNTSVRMRLTVLVVLLPLLDSCPVRIVTEAPIYPMYDSCQEEPWNPECHHTVPYEFCKIYPDSPRCYHNPNDYMAARTCRDRSVPCRKDSDCDDCIINGQMCSQKSPRMRVCGCHIQSRVCIL